MIEIDDVTVVRGERRILKSVTISITGRRTAVIGANGSGKSTLARLLNGLVLPTSGGVRVFGLDTRREMVEVRRRVGFVFQNPDQQIVFPTVEEDLGFGPRNLGWSAHEIGLRLEQTLDQFGLMDLRHQSAHLLSGGEKQLLCLAAVWIMQPLLIVLDEPSTLLDLAHRRRLNRLLLECKTPFVLVTHDLEFARQCDTTIVLERGAIVYAGDPVTAEQNYLARLYA